VGYFWTQTDARLHGVVRINGTLEEMLEGDFFVRFEVSTALTFSQCISLQPTSVGRLL
jgi:hypothetical protein